jgi:cyclin B
MHIEIGKSSKASYQEYLETKENKKEDNQINTNSTADNSQEDSLLSLKSEICDFPSSFNKYFMALRPLRPLAAKANSENSNANFFYNSNNSNQGAAGAFAFNYANNFNNTNLCPNTLGNCDSNMFNPVEANFNCNNNNNKFNFINSNSNLNFPQPHLKSSNTKQLLSNFPSKIFKKTVIPLEIFQEQYDSLIAEEHNFSQCFGYMQQQTDINEKMRAVLIDWLSEVHLKFKLFPETIFLTVNLIDLYLSKKPILKNHLQLCGVAALLIACKYEEIFCPDLSDLVYITDKAYNKEEIIFMEKEILITLNYQITMPTVIKFYDLLAVNFGFDETEFFLGRYFLEIFLMDYRINKYQNSLVACAVVYLVLKINKYEDYRIINCYTLSAEKDLKNCAKEICFLVENIDSTNLLSIKNKYATKEFHEVSKISFK